MHRPPFAVHRRHSITHRAVQRLREFVPGGGDELDDETLRDQLDTALGVSEDAGLAVRTLDAMLGEPQTLVPIQDFREPLFAIIKEETVVTVLPHAHGAEILARGQAMEERIANGEVVVRPPREREEPRRRWRDTPEIVVERIRGRDELDTPGHRASPRVAEENGTPRRSAVVKLENPALPSPRGPIDTAFARAAESAKRLAAIAALGEFVQSEAPDAPLLPLWNAMVAQGLPGTLTFGDFVDAFRPRP